MDLVQVTETVKATPLDIYVGIGLALALAGYGLYAGKSRIVSLILAGYPATLIFEALPAPVQAIFGGNTRLEAAGFFALTIVLMMVVQHSVSGYFTGATLNRWFESIIASVLATGLLVASASRIISGGGMLVVDSPALSFVTSSSLYFVWLILPLVGVLLLARREGM